MNTHCIADGTLRGQGGMVLSCVVVWRGDGCGVGYINKKNGRSLFRCFSAQDKTRTCTS